MKYDAPRLQQMLAAEYVLGTLRGPARRRFERLLAGRASLRDEVRYWERRLASLQNGYAPVIPRAVVWADIDRRINAAPTTPLRKPAPAATLRFWQTWSALATAASLLLAIAWWREAVAPLPAPQIVRVAVPVPQPMPYVAMLNPQGMDAKWLVTLSPERGLIRVSASGSYPIDMRSECLELWVLGDDGTPHSLGVLPMDGEGEMPMPEDMPMPKKPMLAVSKEPMGGSPTGKPTGPVILSAPAQRAS